ncbi:MAG: Bpu10I family restriction endonuclease [Gomphosphaeria aponina SAG 52.96 = DSM 107014]|uniref:Bpu10I family restriction endonuclease n=1 Tax=Gomphosphaeria aponina SAG 52.96 = DSM 107014 TaxID=1521640 RepID=A0A941GT50_9CHRO|nr:Bpu10I family restriction endonuclease [Gomphosphaeria aponina SAG 52.96 = DSM 107014]
MAVLENNKLPSDDLPRITQALKVYHKWIVILDKVVASKSPAAKTLKRMVQLLNIYKFYIDVSVIFDSPNNFLARQKGQLKLDNTIIEEFLPRLIIPSLIPEIQKFPVEIGPMNSFSSVYFESSLDVPAKGGGLRLRTKNQDFAISKKLFIRTSHSPNFEPEITAETETNLAYIAAECKTNLDKTMFQEGCATAHDVKSAVLGAKYFLLCEWLDMNPVSTAPTDIDQVIILRKAKRINANKRKEFSTFSGRQNSREEYINYLKNNPFRLEMFELFIHNIRSLLNQETPQESDVLKLGYF